MSLTEWKDFTNIISNVVVALAAFAGGLWALARYWRERADEAALDIGIDYRTAQLGSDHVVALDVVLTNRGKTKLQAKALHTGQGLAYDDGIERLRHSCDLQLREIRAWNTNANRHLDWFENPVLQPVAGLNPDLRPKSAVSALPSI